MPMNSRRPANVAVIGAGAFGRNHIRIYQELAAAGEVNLAAIADPAITGTAGQDDITGGAARMYSSVDSLLADTAAGAIAIDAASVCVPTVHHAQVAGALLRAGIHVLVEKPFASTVAEADDLLTTAIAKGLILQVGHLERFNPAVTAILPHLTRPMFFECHRLSVFTPRSLDVDVVLDLMIHDLDIVLRMAASPVREIRAVGLPVLSQFADIANVRLEFESGCIGNFTASRVSTERVRKLRLFQPGEYISADYARQDAFRIVVAPGTPAAANSADASDALAGLSFSKLEVTPAEPLRLEIEAFLHSVATGTAPAVPPQDSRNALALALDVNEAIRTHAARAGLNH